jgi:hypothetical protein
MSKFHNDFNNDISSTLENKEYNNEYMKSTINTEGKKDDYTNNYIKDDNLSTKSEEKLSESNASTENNENDKYEYVENLIDLSFLDIGSNEPIEKNININNINNNNYYGSNNNFRNYEMTKENFNYNNCRIENMNDMKYSQLYNMMMLNNYYQRMTYINNFIHNYNLMNNTQNILNKNIPKKNPNIPNKSHPNNKIKKFIDKRYIINLMDIKTNKEQRTTIRMMNIPSYFRPLDLAKKLDEKFGISPQKENRVYDFIYIPFKESKKNEGLINAGYAFINFVHPKHILKFYSFFQGKHLKLKTSGKVCIITFASRQGVNIKNNNFGQSDNDKYMFFSDTKNHFQLLTD